MPTQSATNLQNYVPALKQGFQLPNSVAPGVSTTWGSQTIVLSVHSTSTASAGATTPIAVTPSGGAPVAATVKFAYVIGTNNTNATFEIASSTNTKAFVIYGPVNAGAPLATSSALVVGATSILNVGVAASEVINFVSTTVGGSAILVLGLETAN